MKLKNPSRPAGARYDPVGPGDPPMGPGGGIPRFPGGRGGGAGGGPSAAAADDDDVRSISTGFASQIELSGFD